MAEVSPIEGRSKSRDPSITGNKSPVAYSNRLYEAAKESREYKTKLRDWYDRQDAHQSAKDMTFKPQLNDNRYKLSEKKENRLKEKENQRMQ